MSSSFDAAQLTELVVELIDALTGLEGDHDYRDHLARIDQVIACGPQSVASGLSLARDVIEKRSVAISQSDLALVLGDVAGVSEAVEALKRVPLSSPPFVYHGTCLRNLASIARSGLVANFRPHQWGSKLGVPSDHLAQGVFLSQRWRAAYEWAKVASGTGTKWEEPGNPPVIIRLHRPETIDFDRWSVVRESFIGPQTLSVAGADALVDYRGGFPSWVPLSKVCADLPEESLGA